MLNMSKTFLTFGNDHYYGALTRLKKQATEFNVFDNIIIYKDTDLHQMPEFWDKHKDFILANPRGYGYWIWKSYLTLKTLESMNDNDILVYVDAGCELNKEGKSRLNDYFKIVSESQYGILGFKYDQYLEKTWTKMDLYNYLECPIDNDEQFWAGVTIYKKCGHSMNLVKKWYETCCIYNLINDSLSNISNDPTFNEHRHDQSVWSLLRKKYGCEILNTSEAEHGVLRYNILTPWEHMKKFPIIGIRNNNEHSYIESKSYIESIEPSKITVIQVWTQTVNNCPGSYWGLGDIIRGTCKLYQLSKKMNFKLIVDTQLHPMSKYLNNAPHKYSDLIYNNKNNISFVEDSEQFIKNNNQNVIYFLTNQQCDEFNNHNKILDEDCKQFIKTILTPTPEFEIYINKFNEFNNFNVLHYRLGDDDLMNNNINYMYYDSLVDNMPKIDNSILLSDSCNFKKYIKSKINVFMIDGIVAHMGKSDNDVKDTLREFFIITRAKHIYTHSIYCWISGFVYWAHKIYDIPLHNLK